MLKHKEGTLDSLLLVLMDAIAECKEYQIGNSGLNWHDEIMRNFFDEMGEHYKSKE